MSKEEVKQTYFDGEDHWLTAKEALDLGFIDVGNPRMAETLD